MTHDHSAHDHSPAATHAHGHSRSHSHDQSHGHPHAHEHQDHAGHGSHAGHSHAPASFGRAFAIGIGLNTAFVLVEAGYGLAANSLALLADAGHNLSDVLGLAVAWGAAALAKRQPSQQFSYGLRRSTILAALINAVLLLIAVGVIALEAVQRFTHPQPVASVTVMVVAGIGIVINTATALLFASGRKGDLNIRGAYLHMAADAAVSAGVVVAGLVILQTGWLWLDPITSLLIAAVILWSTWGLLRDSVALSLDAVPRGIDMAQVHAHLAALPGVVGVHDLHVWPISTSQTALTAHLVRPVDPERDANEDAFLSDVAASVQAKHGIDHCTFQIERASGICSLEPDDVV
ncbi:MAG: cation diffusion facilitator family transporter [Burkholderiales bacterium]